MNYRRAFWVVVAAFLLITACVSAYRLVINRNARILGVLSDTYPKLILPDGKILHWADGEPKGSVTISAITSGGTQSLGNAPCPGPINHAVTDKVFVSRVLTSEGPQIVRYELTRPIRVRRLCSGRLTPDSGVVSPDGRRLLISVDGRRSALDLESGRIETLPGNIAGSFGVWGSDGRSVIYRDYKSREFAVTKLDIRSGARKGLLAIRDVGMQSISPGGRAIVYSSAGSFWFRRMDSAHAVRLFAEKGNERPDIAWNRDGTRCAILDEVRGEIVFIAPDGTCLRTPIGWRKGHISLRGWNSDTSVVWIASTRESTTVFQSSLPRRGEAK